VQTSGTGNGGCPSIDPARDGSFCGDPARFSPARLCRRRR
jgi:hypothetical protein